VTRYDPTRHHRRSIRLKGFDYTRAGAYFVTLCAWRRECVFGEVSAGVVQLSEVGQAVVACWQALPRHFERVTLDAMVVMPNHLHGILLLTAQGKGEAFAKQDLDITTTHTANASPQRPIGTQPGSLGAIIQNYKSIATRRINALRGTPGLPVWQRNYYEHIIRNERALEAIRRYIHNNPRQWSLDRDHPAQGRPEAVTAADYWQEVSRGEPFADEKLD
jgi:REP element-mobilizing transposase RayT